MGRPNAGKSSLINALIKSKAIFNEKAKEIGFICPEYKSIQSQITRKINKTLPEDIEKFEDIPEVWNIIKQKKMKNL